MNSVDYLFFRNDISKCGIDRYVTVIPERKDIQSDLSILNLFLLPSREDAFPLVVLEAAQHAIPTICFNNSGGITEFIQSDAGIAVDYLDIEMFCQAILTMKNNPALLRELGSRARERTLEYSDRDAVLREFMICLQGQNQN